MSLFKKYIKNTLAHAIRQSHSTKIVKRVKSQFYSLNDEFLSFALADFTTDQHLCFLIVHIMLSHHIQRLLDVGR